MQVSWSSQKIYTGNVGNIREVLIFANFRRRTHSRIKESRENYYYDSATKEKEKFANTKLRGKFQNEYFAKI